MYIFVFLFVHTVVMSLPIKIGIGPGSFSSYNRTGAAASYGGSLLVSVRLFHVQHDVLTCTAIFLRVKSAIDMRHNLTFIFSESKNMSRFQMLLNTGRNVVLRCSAARKKNTLKTRSLLRLSSPCRKEAEVRTHPEYQMAGCFS